MSQIAHTAPEPVEATPRERLTAAQRRELLERQHDLCGGPCGESLVWITLDKGTKVYGPMIDEHVLPLWLGGSNDLSNRSMWCTDCAKEKTRNEARERGKVLRLERDSKPETRRKSPHRLRGGKFRPADPLKVRP